MGVCRSFNFRIEIIINNSFIDWPQAETKPRGDYYQLPPENQIITGKVAQMGSGRYLR